MFWRNNFFLSELIVNRILVVSIVINKICSIKNLKKYIIIIIIIIIIIWPQVYLTVTPCAARLFQTKGQKVLI